MKQHLLYLLILFALAASSGCERDLITLIDNSGSGDDGEVIVDTTFSSVVNVVFSTTGDATVSGTDDNFNVTVNGNHVTIVYSGDSSIMYSLSGTTTDGFLKLYSGTSQGIRLNNASITNRNGAAINIQGPQSEPGKGKSTYFVLTGANTLADGSSYTVTPSNEDEKAALFSEGQIVFSGNGSLTVNATGKSGIISDKYLQFLSGPTIKVTSTAGHGIRGSDYILISGGNLDVNVSADTKKGLGTDGYLHINGGSTTVKVSGGAAYDSGESAYSGSAGVKTKGDFKINGGTLTITNSGSGGKGINGDGTGYFNGGTLTITTTGSNYTAGDISSKGIKFDGNLLFAGSNVTVNCSANEGIESKGTISVTDGIIYCYSASDDAINSGGDFTISGGYVFAYAPSNDGMDANGNFYITGGLVYAIGSNAPEVAIDANTEEGYRLYVQGGTLIAIGGLENGAALTQSCYSAASWSANTWYALTVGGSTYAFKTPASGGTPLVVSGASTPTLQSGVTVSGGTTIFNSMLTTGASISGGSSVSLSSYTGGNGGGGPGGGPGGGGPGGGWKLSNSKG